MRGNIGRHTDSDTRRSVDQQVGKAAGQNRRLFLCLIEVGHESDRVLIDVRPHFHGNFGQSGLGISHGRGPVSVHAAEISVAVDKCVAHGPGLCHIDQRTID